MLSKLRNRSGSKRKERSNLLHVYWLPILLLLSMRPLQWTKNLVIFAPILFTVNQWWVSSDLTEASRLLLRVLVAFVLFSALSGVVYLINDVVDREKDRLHPRKRERPIASGRVSVPLAVATVLLVTPVSLGSAFLFSIPFGIILSIYFSLNVGYSFLLKNVVLVDVLIVASGYVLRLAAGSIVVQEATSPWLYLTIGLGALLLALGKRHAELADAKDAAPEQRPVLQGYSPVMTGQLMNISATSTILAYALHTFTGDNLPENHAMMLTIPFVIFGVFRYLYLVTVKSEGENPELLMFKDLTLAVNVAVWLLAVVFVLVWVL